MSDILSQEEIEALLNSLQGESVSDSAPAPQLIAQPASSSNRNAAQKAAIAYEVYDFRRPDKFSKEQLRTLQMLHETFARLSGSSLSAYLRTHVNIDLISLEQVPYEEYLRSINSSVFTIMSLPPLTGQAVMEMEFGLVFCMIDRLLGGPGRTVNRNVLTDIERPLVRQTVERMFSALKSAWEGIVVVNPGIDGMETSAQFVQIAPPTDIVVTILFEVRVGNVRGAMSLCIPFLILKPITTKLSAQKWFVTTNRKHSPLHRRQLAVQVQNTPVEACIQLGKSRLQVREFMGLQVGDVLRLDQHASKDITMLVSGTEKFYGMPAMNGKKLAFTVAGLVEK